MAKVNDDLVNFISLTIKATEKIDQLSGGKSAILNRSASGGTAIARVVLDSALKGSSGVSEVGKGSNVNTSA